MADDGVKIFELWTPIERGSDAIDIRHEDGRVSLASPYGSVQANSVCGDQRTQISASVTTLIPTTDQANGQIPVCVGRLNHIADVGLIFLDEI